LTLSGRGLQTDLTHELRELGQGVTLAGGQHYLHAHVHSVGSEGIPSPCVKRHRCINLE